MTFPLTDRAQRKLDQINIEPTYAFCIDGYDACFTAVAIQKLVRFDDGLNFDTDVWDFDGVVDIEGQKTYISLEGSSKKINQQLSPDKGSISSISSVTIRMIDKNFELSKLISPGVELTDILGASGNLYIGFKNTAFPQDYIKIFRGPISDIISGPGYVEFTLNHPDEKKRESLFIKFETKLNGAIDASTTTINLDSVTGLINPSDCVRSFVKIDDEFIEYTGTSGTQLTGVTRGALALYSAKAAAAAHDDDANAVSFYLFEEGAIDLALKLMLSDGTNGDFISGVEMTHFGATDEGLTDNAIFIQGVNIAREYGLVAGDFVSTSGATEVANQLTLEQIVQILETEDGSYIEVAGPLTYEPYTSATLSFRSKYAVLPEGLGMTPQEVDVERHEFIKETFLASFEMRFYIDDTIENAKEFIEKELYVPAAMYSLPRGTKSSTNLHIAPFPFAEIQTLNQDNIMNPSKLKLRRNYASNFYNNIIYKFDRDLYEDKYNAGTVSINAQSISEVKKRKDFVIESKGMRSDLQAVSLAATASSRLLDRYKRGAEFIENIDVFFSDAVTMEPGDIIIFDPEGLQITNTIDGTRSKEAKFWEIQNKTLDLSGRASLNIVDTSFDGAQRYALFSPASYIVSGTTTSIIIKASFSAPYGANEWRKWKDYVGAQVQIRNATFTDVGVSTIVGISNNTISLSPALSFTPGADYIMEFAPYDQQTSERVKLLFTHNSDGENPFADGGDPYRYL